MQSSSVLVQPIRPGQMHPGHRRASVRHGTSMEATSHVLDEGETISWGAVINDLSAGGVGITLCYPFRPGTYLAIDLPRKTGGFRTVLVRVVHVSDRNDGAWHLGCEFVTPMTEDDAEMLVF